MFRLLYNYKTQIGGANLKLDQYENEIIEMIRNSKDPTAALAEAIKVILCYEAQRESSQRPCPAPAQE